MAKKTKDPALTLCPDCGSTAPGDPDQGGLTHAKSCSLVESASLSGCSPAVYARSPELWCYVLSGFAGEEVRCVLSLGHEGGHGFPSGKLQLEYQQESGALQAALDVAALAESARPALPVAEARVRASRTRTNLEELGPKTIHLLTTENPKKKGSKAHAAFASYKEGMTVSAFLELGTGSVADIKYDTKSGFIELR